MDSDYRHDAGPPSRARPADETTLVDSSYDHNAASKSDNPSSSLLRGLLREKKAENRRMSRVLERENSDTNKACDPREVQSSPLGSMTAGLENTRRSKQASGLGARSVSAPKVMGLRETQEFITTLSKQNFDLQLSLTFERQQKDVLREQIEKLKVSEDEHVKTQEDLEAEHAKAQKVFDAEIAEAQKINDELLQQLERREQAIEEAVTIICQLEEKIEMLESTLSPITSSTTVQHVQPETLSNKHTLPQLESTASGSVPKTPEVFATYHNSTPSDIPSSTSLQKTARTASMLHKTPLSKPSFLKSDNGSAGTLRSLYLEGEKNPRESPKFASTTRPLSLLSRDEDGDSINPEDYYRMKTPPLSILSKSSFQSIYGTPEGPVIGPPHISYNDPDLQQRSIRKYNDEGPQPEQRKPSRIHQWMDDKESPLKSRHISPRHGFTEPIVSIGSLLEKEEFNNEQSNSRPNETTEPLDNVTVPPSPGTMCTANESLRDGPPTLAPNHPSQEESTRPVSADSCASELARIELSFGTPEWFGTPGWNPKPDKSISIGEEKYILHQSDDQDSPELPLPWTGNVAGRIHEEPSATADLVPHGDNMMFNGDDYLPTQYMTQLRYKYYPSHGESPPRTTRNVSPRARNPKQTPSPLKISQHMQELENPEAQHYQRLVTPPSHPKSTMTRSDTESKLPRVSSFRTTSSSLSLTPLLPARPEFSSHIFPSSQSQSIKARDTQQENSPLTQRQSLDVGKQRAGSLNIAPSLLPQAPRTPLRQRAPTSRIARPGTAGSVLPQRASSSVITRRETHAFSTDTTTTSEEEGFLTPSTNSHDDSAAETPCHNDRRQVLQNESAGSQLSNRAVVSEGPPGRKWGKHLGRTASLKIKQSFGWKKGEN
ncbi:hypothetical protein MMC17_009850 [Xylographa soralifera]|nr:hypothetical protein [Xylographa soralifera]